LSGRTVVGVLIGFFLSFKLESCPVGQFLGLTLSSRYDETRFLYNALLALQVGRKHEELSEEGECLASSHSLSKNPLTSLDLLSVLLLLVRSRRLPSRLHD
jgi:hypothetical protein